MHDHSFEFAGTDMFTAYGLRIRKKHDVLKPPLRERKIVIPSRSGAYDFGARYYDERTLLVECDTIRQLTADDKRELAFLLSQKGTIRFWDEDDKQYIGRIYDAAEVERVGGIGTYFPLTFICDPFAYKTESTYDVRGYGNADHATFTVDYQGTAPTPGKIVFRNDNANATISGIQIAIKQEV